MPRNRFAPISFRLPLTAVAALADAMAMIEGTRRLARRTRLPRLAVGFRLRFDVSPTSAGTGTLSKPLRARTR